jgi:transposase
MNKYRILPPLPPDQYAALKQDIATNGVLNPVIVDAEGNVIDGFSRMQIIRELKLKNYPMQQLDFKSDAEKYEAVIKLNALRRSLSGKQKRELISTYLKRDAAIADNWLAKILGVSTSTVRTVRSRLEGQNAIEKPSVRRGKDGKIRKAHYKRICISSPKQLARACEVIDKLPEPATAQNIDLWTAERRVRRAGGFRKADNTGPHESPSLDAIKLYHCDFRDLQRKSGLLAGSVDYICTDIEYRKAWLPNVEGLAKFGKTILRDGGVLTTYSGLAYLPEVLAGFAKHLTYRWSIAAMNPPCSGKIRQHGTNCVQKWKAIPIYTNGGFSHDGFSDMFDWAGSDPVLQRSAAEKEWHPWQQPLEEAIKLVTYFTKPNDLVCDPCAGSFTVAVACLLTGRRFVGCDLEKQNVLNGQQRLFEAAFETARVPAFETDYSFYNSDALSPSRGSLSLTPNLSG